MKKILLVIAPADFRDSEYFIPKNIIESSGIGSVTSSTVIGKITGADQKTAISEILLKDVMPDNFSAVLFIGGPGMSNYLNSPEMINVAISFASQNKIIGAICIAPAILANAGILSGKKATSWDGVKDIIERAGATYSGDEITVDHNIITANGPGAAEEFARTLVAAISKNDPS